MKKLLTLSVGLFYIGLPVAQAESKFVPIQDLNQVQEKGSLKVASEGDFHHGHHHHHHHHFHGHHGHHHHFFNKAGSQTAAQAVPSAKVVPIQDLKQVQEKGSLKVANEGYYHHGHHHHHHHFHGHHGHHHFHGHHHHFFHSKITGNGDVPTPKRDERG